MKPIFILKFILIAAAILQASSGGQLPGTEYGGMCSSNASCPVAGSYCNYNFMGGTAKKGICKCSPTHVSFGNKCHPKLTSLSDPCKENYQCLLLLGPNTVCENNKCICYATSVLIDGSCYEKQTSLGALCQDSLQCSISGAECSKEGSCACKMGYITVGNECLPIGKEFGDPCKDKKQCEPALGRLASCENLEQSNNPQEKVCICRNEAVFSNLGGNATCLVKATKPGQECKEDFQCSGFWGKAECRDGGCACVGNASFVKKWGFWACPFGGGVEL